MKEQKPLLLVELLVMLLVFSLAAALCLRGFAWAEEQSKLLQQQNQATIRAQNAAELLKATRGDYEQLGVARVGERWSLTYREDGDTFSLQITPEKWDIGGLAGARVEVYLEDGARLICLTVRWQGVAE